MSVGLGAVGLVRDCMVNCLSLGDLRVERVREWLHLRVSISLMFGNVVTETYDDDSINTFGFSVALRALCCCRRGV